MAVDLDSVVTQLSGLTVLEAAELVKKLEEKWGVSAAAPVAVAAAPAAGGGAAAAPAEEKTSFTVVLKEAGANKIGVIKEVRAAVAGLGLADEAGL
ncbi:MAG: 50S ribosomal protein L7/L12, partial [Verrucomicrobiia bacterium]